MTELEMEALRSEVSDKLAAASHISVATGSHRTVTARTVDYVSLGIGIGFFTWMESQKVADILTNTHIALCLDNLQIEGTARLHDKASPEIAAYLQRYRWRMPAIYDKFMGQAGTTFVCVDPTKISIMRCLDAMLVRDHLDLIRYRAYRSKLSDW